MEGEREERRSWQHMGREEEKVERQEGREGGMNDGGREERKSW